MRREKTILPCIAAAAIAASCAFAASARYPISKEQVAAAVSNGGVAVAPEQVTLLADVVASTRTPRLTVSSIQRWGNQRMMARLECESSDECLPFFVSVKVDPGVAGAPSVVRAPLPASVSTPKHFLVKSGTPATLLLDGERVHIRLAVICMESGVAGQTIRAMDRDRKVVFRAQVIDGGLLQGRL